MADSVRESPYMDALSNARHYLATVLEPETLSPIVESLRSLILSQLCATVHVDELQSLLDCLLSGTVRPPCLAGDDVQRVALEAASTPDVVWKVWGGVQSTPRNTPFMDAVCNARHYLRAVLPRETLSPVAHGLMGLILDQLCATVHTEELQCLLNNLLCGTARPPHLSSHDLSTLASRAGSSTDTVLDAWMGVKSNVTSHIKTELLTSDIAADSNSRHSLHSDDEKGLILNDRDGCLRLGFTPDTPGEDDDYISPVKIKKTGHESEPAETKVEVERRLFVPEGDRTRSMKCRRRPAMNGLCKNRQRRGASEKGITKTEEPNTSVAPKVDGLDVDDKGSGGRTEELGGETGRDSQPKTVGFTGSSRYIQTHYSSSEELRAAIKLLEDVTGIKMENYSTGRNYAKGYVPASIDTLRWSWSSPTFSMPYDGVPFVFVSLGRRAWQCIYGVDRNAAQKRREDMHREAVKYMYPGVQRRATYGRTKKVGCGFVIHATELIRLPHYKWDQPWPPSRRETFKVKNEINRALEAGELATERLFLMARPLLNTHCKHALPPQYASIAASIDTLGCAPFVPADDTSVPFDPCLVSKSDPSDPIFPSDDGPSGLIVPSDSEPSDPILPSDVDGSYEYLVSNHQKPQIRLLSDKNRLLSDPSRVLSVANRVNSKKAENDVEVEDAENEMDIPSDIDMSEELFLVNADGNLCTTTQGGKVYLVSADGRLTAADSINVGNMSDEGQLSGEGSTHTEEHLTNEGLSATEGYFMNGGNVKSEGYISNEGGGYFVSEGQVTHEGYLTHEGHSTSVGYLISEGHLSSDGHLPNERHLANEGHLTNQGHITSEGHFTGEVHVANQGYLTSHGHLTSEGYFINAAQLQSQLTSSVELLCAADAIDQDVLDMVHGFKEETSVSGSLHC